MATKKIGIGMLMHDPYEDKSTLPAKLNRINSAFIACNSLHHSESCHLTLLLAPEYYFANAELSYYMVYKDTGGTQAPRSRPYNMAEYGVVYDQVKWLSERCTQMMIIPGTFMIHDGGFNPSNVRPPIPHDFDNTNFRVDLAYKDALPEPLFGGTKGGGGSPTIHTTSVYNIAPVFYDGKVGVYRKRAPFYELGRPNDMAKRARFYRHNPRSDVYEKNRYRFVPGVVPGYFRRGPRGQEVTVGLEICFDHACSMLRKDLNNKIIGRVDLHIILSASVGLESSNVCARSGGYVVHCSSEPDDCEVRKYTRRKYWANSLSSVPPKHDNKSLQLRTWLIDLEDE